jgi:CDP-diacylglycerol--glycerol-3-phosphate 3-phosphatidyltransferase
MANSQWTFSNLLSISRVALLPAILYVFLLNTHTGTILAFFLLCLAALTDYLDGYFARKWNQVSEYGKIIDPIADKICVGVMGIAFVSVEKLPLWFFLLIISRDAMILLAGMWLKSSKKIVLSSNRMGKWAVTIVACTFLLALFIPYQQFSVQFLIYCSTVMLFVSFFQYLQRFYKIIFTDSR